MVKEESSTASYQESMDPLFSSGYVENVKVEVDVFDFESNYDNEPTSEVESSTIDEPLGTIASLLSAF